MNTGPTSATILLAEDDMCFRYACARLLRKAGFHVIEAFDGLAAIEISYHTTADMHLLLSDVHMPRIGGVAAAATIQEQRPEIKVLLMTSSSLPASGQIVKPVDFDARLAKIGELLPNHCIQSDGPPSST